MEEILLKGIPTAGGIAIGRAFILDKQDFIVPPRTIMDEEVPVEIARFEEALQKTRQEILTIQKKISDQIESRFSKIFDAHLLVLEDETLIQEVIQKIQSDKLSAEYVFFMVLKKYIDIFSKIEDNYLRERVTDVEDVGRRIIRNLVDESKLHDLQLLNEEVVLVAHDLSPSDTASLYNKKIIAFVTDVGGKTSHTAIMAKSLGIPAIVGLKDATLKIKNQDLVIVDGIEGRLYLNPTEERLNSYQESQNKIRQIRDQFKEITDLPAVTKDGVEVDILANLELADEISMLKGQGAKGVGLYRTEYLYMNRQDLPSEEEQFLAYKKVVEAMQPYPVTIRTLDIGGDKFISSLQIPQEMYASLGWRAIRFCLERQDIFRMQLRAILRASAFGRVRIMFPMISCMNEIRQAKSIVEEVKASLEHDGISFDHNIQVGIMIEVPSAVVIADHLAKEVNFFSIGTNDLIQYSLAIERVNEKTAYLYDPGHPAILRMIKMTIDAAHREDVDVDICGEMGSDPMFVSILLGMGLKAFSMSPSSLLVVKKLIRSLYIGDVQDLAREVLEMDEGGGIKHHADQRLRVLVPEIFQN